MSKDKIPWDLQLATFQEKETGYPLTEIIWLTEIVYRYHKAKTRTKFAIANMLKVCKESNITSLYSIYGSLVEEGVIKKKDIHPEYRRKMEEAQRIKERPTIVENDWYKGFM